jgi:hypothetical protein
MSYTPTRLLLLAIAKRLNDTNIGTFSLTNPYADTDTGIILKTQPDKPDRCITLNWVPASTDGGMPHMTGVLQAACRGKPDNPLDSDDLADQCDQTLDGITQLDCGAGVVVNLCSHRNSVNMGQDDLKRWTTATQYTVELDTPGTLLKPATGAWQ